METTIYTHSPEETKKAALDYLKNNNKSSTIYLYGDLASGKTTFVQGIGEYFGIKRMLSPTYVIVRQYPVVDSRFDNLYHLDLYRLDSISDLKAFNLDEIMDDQRNLVMIEWSERLKDQLASQADKIFFFSQEGDDRKIIIKNK